MNFNMKKYNENFTTLPTEAIDKITRAVNEQGCTPILICRETNHPEDDKLFVVIARYNNSHHSFDNSYVVWNVNTFYEKASLNYGHYYISFKSAMEIVADKIRDLNKEKN